MSGMYPGIVITDPGGSADIVLQPIPLASGGRNEAWLRDFLLRHPSVLPTAAIDPAYADLIPVCRELRTSAGPLDCLFVTRFGGLVIVECKLWRNPQARREVVGQILDYAKEVTAWKYADLQREVSIARQEPGTNALFNLVATRHPGCNEAEFVDAVTRNLNRGRLMLLVAGDGIREGTESIVQYVGRYAGLHLTFGLVEVAGYELPDGRLLVQPRLLARTTNIERAVIRVEGPAAELASIQTPEEAATTSVGEDASEDPLGSGVARKFDPVVLQADRSWRSEFVKRVQLDDPAQAVGQVGYGRVFLSLPVTWAWMTAYSTRRDNRCGNTLVLKGQGGEELFDALEAERAAIEDELLARGHGGSVTWQRVNGTFVVNASRTFPGVWAIEQEPIELDWLLYATNIFVNVIRPRVLRLLPTAPTA